MTKLQNIQVILNVSADDVWGPISEKAMNKEITESRERNAAGSGGELIPGELDERSAKNIRSLHPQVRETARAFMLELRNRGMRFKVTSGYRTYKEQEILHQKYLSGGPKAAPPGYSNHNFGIAFDITQFRDDEKTPIWESANYAQAGRIGEGLGLTWGGRWKGKDQDEPHYCRRPAWAKGMGESQLIAGLRFRINEGRDVWV